MHYTENFLLVPPEVPHFPISCLNKTECSSPFNVTYLDYFSLPIMGQNCISAVNFVIQVMGMEMVYTTKKFKMGSFFFLLLILALSVIFRSLTSIITMIMAAFTNTSTPLYSLATTISLYVDYISNNFSMILIFFMSLNRCLLFVKRTWSDQIFEGNRIAIPIFLSLVMSILGALTSIRTSEIKRIYESQLGFVDFGQPVGFRKLITRLFYLFPLASAACYIILLFHLHQKKKKLAARKRTNNQGEQNVFIQILITVIFYGIMSITSELLESIDQPGYELQITLICIFNLLNYLPELSLPFLLLVNHWRPKRKVSVFVAATNSNNHSLTKQTERAQVKLS